MQASPALVPPRWSRLQPEKLLLALLQFENEPTPSQKREVKQAAEKDPNIVKVHRLP